eukprot:COSAG01_NODE_9704_length_2365_cov_29.402030_1_plen_85_part_00
MEAFDAEEAVAAMVAEQLAMGRGDAANAHAAAPPLQRTAPPPCPPGTYTSLQPGSGRPDLDPNEGSLIKHSQMLSRSGALFASR